MRTFADGASGMTGDGTADNPYVVMTLEQLDDVREDLDAHYVLGADIDASATAASNGGAGFAPIGDLGGSFVGTFDGAGHVIRGLTIERPAEDNVGLFGLIGASGVVKRLGLEELSIVGHTWIGGIAGRMEGRVEDSHVTGTVESTGALVGGLFGYTGRDAKVRRSYAEADVSGVGLYAGGLVGRSDGEISESYATGNVSGGGYTGGLAGINEVGEIYRSYATGDVSATVGQVGTTGGQVGGLLGYNFGALVSDTYATGDVSGDFAVGGLVGMTDYGLISKSYATGNITGNTMIGGLIGSNNGGYTENLYWDTETSNRPNACGFDNNYGGICEATGLTTAQALTQGSYHGFGFTDEWYMVDGSTRPFLRAEWSASIRTPHQLQLMAMDPTTDYTLANDIDFGSALTDDRRSDLWATSAGEGLGFAPVGATAGGPYVGIFDGAGHVIRGLTIRRPYADNVGMFGRIGSGGIVRNVGLESGAIAGRNSVGSLAGYNDAGEVERAYSTSSVSGTQSVGGLVGTNDAGLIENAYAAAPVAGDGEVGGLVGHMPLGTIRSSYAVGRVVGRGDVGGLAGAMSGGSVVDSFYDRETTGESDDTGKGDPLSTAAMKRFDTYPAASWDFAGTWSLTEGKTYPVLRGIAANLEMDIAPPTVSGAAIEAAHPSRVIVSFDEDVSASSGAGFAIRVDGSAAGIASVEGVGSQTRELTFFLEEAAEYGHTVTLSYDPLFGHVVDQATVPLLGFAGLAVDTSDIPMPDVVPPTIAVTMTEADGGEYEIDTWTNQPVAVRATATDDVSVASFVYSVDGGAGWSEYAAQDLVLQEEGANTVLFKATDAAGNEATEKRTVNISWSGLRLTPTLMKANGDAYADGAWSNLSVTVSVYAEAGASGFSNLTVSRDGGAAETYENATPLVLDQEGVHMFLFQAADAAGNTLSMPLTMRIDKTAPTVSFDPNGNEDPSRTAATTVSVADGGAGSGLDASTLQYAWSTDITVPSEGWTRFASGDNLARNEGDGDWYLHIRAADAAGNETNVVSNRFRMYAPPPSEAPGGTGSYDDDHPAYTNYSIGTNGATLTFRGTRIVIPGGALGRTFTLMVAEIDDPSHLPLPEGAQWAGSVIDLKKDVDGPFGKDITLTLQLTDGFTPAEGSEIGLFWLNEETNEWVPLNDITVDEAAWTVSGTTDHFTVFAALAIPVEEPSEPKPPVQSEANFTDIAGHWAQRSILDLAERGAVTGYPDGSFRPDRTVTRAEFAAMLVRALNLPAVDGSPFADTERHWARQAVSAAYARGILRGRDAYRFAPDDLVTREEMALMAVNALQPDALPTGTAFADQSDVAPWARQAVAAAANLGVVSGYRDNAFRPQAHATRAEAVAVILRALEIES
ncbi:S-layer homology domain-containing protein [Paenibacillus sp.]|uniref:S-layer homology domain-containing protein n=1 Tax=Paenibacillus sp. TaxID=58172 RepID=UPI002811613C|nr:S-layer homology domain-containing protein [Paenibacillus sp.]